jgi:uncharacterized protein
MTHSASAVSFNCEKAHSASEQLICSDPSLSDLDDAFASAFKAAIARSSDKAALKKAAVEEWKQREKHCHDKTCLLAWYERRILDLNGVTPERSQDTTVPAKQASSKSASSIPLPSVYERLSEVMRTNLQLSDEQARAIMQRTFPRCRNVKFGGPIGGSYAEVHVLAQMNKEMFNSANGKAIRKQIEKAFDSGIQCREDAMHMMGCVGMGYGDPTDGELAVPVLANYRKYGESYADYVAVWTKMSFRSGGKMAVPMFVEKRNVQCIGNAKATGIISGSAKELLPP